MSAPGAAQFPRTPLEWLKFFGPGAILASLTIGVGELVFSTRAGALFGYKLLWFFALVLFFKWLLVYSTARHMILTGAHPFQRWMDLPGPRGWFALIFLWLAILSFPIWIGFHSGTLGTLIAALTRTQGGSSHFIWGMVMLGIVAALALAGSYKLLERAQIAIVAIMLLSVLAAFFLLKPQWPELLAGLIPQAIQYPDWASNFPELRNRPLWVETITYGGIIGGSGYDYLAYTSYLRDKGWGRAGSGIDSQGSFEGVRPWLKAVLFDSIFSFVAVLVFTVVFTACGAMILRPERQIPAGTDLLTLQTQFLTPLFPALKPLYFAGAFLAVFGTLYGTIEVAPAILRELALAIRPESVQQRKIRAISILWVCGGGLIVLAASLAFHRFGKTGSPPTLVAILTPANLFTGVLACGFVCALSIWADFRWLPKSLRMPAPLVALNAVAALFFLASGVKGYVDYGSGVAWIILAGTILAGVASAWLIRK